MCPPWACRPRPVKASTTARKLAAASRSAELNLKTRFAKGLVIEACSDKGRGPPRRSWCRAVRLGAATVLAGVTARAMSKTASRFNRPARPLAEIQGLTEVPAARRADGAVRRAQGAKIALFRQGVPRRHNRPPSWNRCSTTWARARKRPPLSSRPTCKVRRKRFCAVAGPLPTDEVRVQVVHAAVGGTSETDINLAIASKVVASASTCVRKKRQEAGRKTMRH